MKILIFKNIASWLCRGAGLPLSSGAVTPAAPGALKNTEVKPEPTPDETLQKMLNTLVEWKILTPKEAELYLMIEDLPDDIPERIAQMYRDMVEKLKY